MSRYFRKRFLSFFLSKTDHFLLDRCEYEVIDRSPVTGIRIDFYANRHRAALDLYLIDGPGLPFIPAGILDFSSLALALHLGKQSHSFLGKELARKEKALAETAALLVLRKKADAIWGDNEDE
jgi:hypothetical protein